MSDRLTKARHDLEQAKERLDRYHRRPMDADPGTLAIAASFLSESLSKVIAELDDLNRKIPA